MNKKLLTAIAILTVFGTIVSLVESWSPMPVLAAGLLVLFLVYSLWDPPHKHKNFSYEDQQKATARAFGGGVPPDLSNLKPQERRERER